MHLVSFLLQRISRMKCCMKNQQTLFGREDWTASDAMCWWGTLITVYTFWALLATAGNLLISLMGMLVRNFGKKPLRGARIHFSGSGSSSFLTWIIAYIFIFSHCTCQFESKFHSFGLSVLDFLLTFFLCTCNVIYSEVVSVKMAKTSVMDQLDGGLCQKFLRESDIRVHVLVRVFT